ncbi:cytochrome-c peroxidase [Gallibacterium salpingitidis]|uniref:cytochrome-c peroxidase n=1 Tax=Gallibacterium salpingitidis TaxID=505341 RepID=UPI001E60E19D|nr:cytochrome-c peroxidase [Gallibacterium salpingitidis]
MLKTIPLAALSLLVAAVFPFSAMADNANIAVQDLPKTQQKITAQEMQRLFTQKHCTDCHSSSAAESLPYADKQQINIGKKSFLVEAITEQLNHLDNITIADLAKLQYFIAHYTDEQDLHSRLPYQFTAEESALLNQWTEQLHSDKLPHTDQQTFILPIPERLPVDFRKVMIGGMLFTDNRLSFDNSVSCFSCHLLDNGGVDGLAVSTGIAGKQGVINAPTVYNAVFNTSQFWDGRAKNLAEQAAQPPLNPVEMGYHNWQEIEEKFAKDPQFLDLFLQVYPELTQANMTDAIAEFEKRLITPNSPFDRYLKGDTSALTEQQKRGYQLFKEDRCDTCHSGINMGGNSFEIMGIYADYIKDRGTPETSADLGRYNQTQQENDKYRFKVPSLRNIALTAPYFHDARTNDLHQAVNLVLKYQLGKTLSAQQVDDIVAFLESLTGEVRGKPLTKKK